MINKEEYENGLRCKGICAFCKSRMTCYQGIQFQKAYDEYTPIETNNESEIKQLKEELKHKDNEIIMLNRAVKYYKQFAPTMSIEDIKKEYECEWMKDDPCYNCSTNTLNGGSGMCNCSLSNKSFK